MPEIEARGSSVDGEEEVRRMHLPNGQSASGEKVRITEVVK